MFANWSYLETLNIKVLFITYMTDNPLKVLTVYTY